MQEYNKIADQDRTAARILEVLIQYQGSARALKRDYHLHRIGRIIPLRCTSRGFRSIYTAINKHADKLRGHGFSPEAIAFSVADILDVALLQLNAE